MNLNEQVALPKLAVVIPASGVGSRVGASIPKQYIPLLGQPILAHTIEKFINLPFVSEIIVVIANNDEWFSSLAISNHANIHVVIGGKERADSVLNGLKVATELGFDWVMVHDAARPCVLTQDIEVLYKSALLTQQATILGSKVRDTMKRTLSASNIIKSTISRDDLWHAFTPQCCKTDDLIQALSAQIGVDGLVSKLVTDEASALELAGFNVDIIESSARNIKVTHQDDIELASFYLRSEKNEY